MATTNDVVNALVTTIAATKPAGLSVSYFPGTPIPEQLQSALKAGHDQVSVFPYNTGRRVKNFLDNEDKIISDTNGSSVIINDKSRQTRWFQLHVWATDPVTRDNIGESIKLTLDSINFIPLPDNQSGRVQWMNEMEDDSQEAAGIYHRTYLYSVEYATWSKQTVKDACLPQILNKAGQVVTPGSGASPLVQELT